VLRQGGEDGSLRTPAHPRMVAAALLGAITSTALGDAGSVADMADVLSELVLEGLVPKGGS
jgi:hypothetical protein